MNRSLATPREAPLDAHSRAQIEAIVRAVLARLRDAAPGADDCAQAPSHGTGGSGRQDRGGPASEPVHLGGPVISVATIEALPPDIGKASVSATAVVTPAARDAARGRGLQLTIAAPPATSSAAAPRLLLADADCPLRLTAAVKQLQRRGVAVVPVAVPELVAQLRAGGSTGLLLTDLPAPHVCDACRHESIRAAAVGSPDEAQAIAAAMDVNLWVVDMKRLPLARMLMLLQQLADAPTGSPTPTTERASR